MQLTVELQVLLDHVAALAERGLGVGGVFDDALDVVSVVLGYLYLIKSLNITLLN